VPPPALAAVVVPLLWALAKLRIEAAEVVAVATPFPETETTVFVGISTTWPPLRVNVALPSATLALSPHAF
jgi:hypothetical protein